ncbi:MAG: GTP-binding protein, partial [Candidatus Omnitrophota bacterium]|nr:GTP-binding protein [Candidatus Omnitrophota bacterium]
MEKGQLKFIIVGHVDHGKSTLIGRLLYDTDSLPADKVEEIRRISKDLGTETEFAYLLDHLEEERRQNVTIDITQVFLKSAGSEYVIIDAPGHVEFVKNMITGASQAEAAVLIIDAKEGLREQTKRHSYILSLLGIDQVIVVVNKMDLMAYDKEAFERTKKETNAHLRDIGITALFYIPISALKGENIVIRSEAMPWYTGPSFLESLGTLSLRRSPIDKPLLFPIQDVYKIGDKRIAVGKIEAGVIKKDEMIKILPHNQLTKVSSIEKFPCQADRA